MSVLPGKALKRTRRSRLTCVTHVVVKRRVREMPRAARLVARIGIVAALVLGGGVGVRAQIPRLHRGLRFQTRVVARFDFRNASEHVVEAEAVADLVDHCVGVTECPVEGRIQNDPS